MAPAAILDRKSAVKMAKFLSLLARRVKFLGVFVAYGDMGEANGAPVWKLSVAVLTPGDPVLSLFRGGLWSLIH